MYIYVYVYMYMYMYMYEISSIKGFDPSPFYGKQLHSVGNSAMNKLPSNQPWPGVILHNPKIGVDPVGLPHDLL